MATSNDAAAAPPHPNRRRTCPRRPYGSVHSNPRISSTVPIIGLGCSSFSNFYAKTPRDGDQEKDDDHGGSSANGSNDSHMVDQGNIGPGMPVVKGWVEAIKHAVLDCGITLLDTAPWYGHGTSELVIGYAMKEILLSPQGDGGEDDGTADNDGQDGKVTNTRSKVRRADVTINTKVGRYDADPKDMFNFSYDRTISSIHKSIERMHCGYIDVIQLHDPEFAPSIDILLEETIPALLKCREEGLVRAIGITGYPLEVQREILARATDRTNGGRSTAKGVGGLVFDQTLTYCHCNLHDMSLFEPMAGMSDQEEEHDNGQAAPASFADWCHSRSVALMAAAPLSMGLLTQSGPPEWHPATDSLKAACRNAASLCASDGVDIAKLAILYALSQVGVACTLLGMKSVEEVDRAMEVATRFEGMTTGTCTAEDLLRDVLTDSEKNSLAMLLDEKKGPFAGVRASGEFLWDGSKQATEFWEQVPGGKAAAERAMKIRKAK